MDTHAIHDRLAAALMPYAGKVVAPELRTSMIADALKVLAECVEVDAQPHEFKAVGTEPETGATHAVELVGAHADCLVV